MILLFWIVCCLVGVLFFYMTSRRNKLNLPPMCPSTLWSNIIRSGFPSLTHKVEQCEWVADHTDQNIERGAVFRMAMPLPYHFITCCDHRLGRLLLSGSSDGKQKEAEKSSTISNLNLFPGVYNILTYPTSNEERSRTRKFLAPAFSTTNLQKTALRVLEEEALDLLQVLDCRITAATTDEAPVVDMKEECIAVVFNMLCKSLLDTPSRHGGTACGDCVSVMAGFDSESFLEAQNSSLREAVRMANNPLRWLMIWAPERREALRCRKRLMQLGANMLQNYRMATEGNAEWAEQDQSIMGYLVRHDYPSEQHRISDLIIFLIAGHETTAMSLSFFLLCMARNPTCRQKLHAELDAALAPNEVPSLNTVSGLEYFSWCYKEVQRLFPVAPVVGRQVSGDDITYNGMLIPQHSIVAVNLYAMGRQRWIDQATEFLPERWSTDNPQASALRDLLMPFSVGKRSCIGQNLATMEMKILAAMLFRNFEFDVACDVELELFITLKPKSLNMSVKRRT